MIGLTLHPNGTPTQNPGPFAFAEAVRTQRSPASTWLAVAAHLAVFALIVFLLRPHIITSLPFPHAQSTLEQTLTDPPKIIAPTLAATGGGHSDPLPTSHGVPQTAPIALLQPMISRADDPRLIVKPTLESSMKMADSTLPLGLLNATGHSPSLGPGIGKDGIGPGAGPGAGPGSSAGVNHIGGNILAPRPLFTPDPEYSEEARRTKFSGDVQVYLWVDEHGLPTHVRVVRGIGQGLDEKAIEAVRQYRFKPATQNGRPVKVDMYIDVNFNIF